jgi:YidC/Oxa1 family membrane protein insertase
MTVFMLWIGWGSPAGVLLFWGVSSLFGVFQQQITMRALKAEDEKKEAEIVDVKPVKVEVERKVKKKRPHKSR